jgi:hypothetical protein
VTFLFNFILNIIYPWFFADNLRMVDAFSFVSFITQRNKPKLHFSSLLPIIKVTDIHDVTICPNPSPLLELDEAARIGQITLRILQIKHFTDADLNCQRQPGPGPFQGAQLIHN